MSATADVSARPLPVAHFLRKPGERSMLRVSTAGSVDDGKSTLIGRLLHDTQSVYEDQLDAVRKSPVNRAGGAVDLSLLTDGLRAEREQGITIDVAYRYFSTPRRTFILADTPGHEQYTPNMATGASTADVAVILVDARKGLLAQSRRHAFIAALLGVRELVVAVNKMDLVGYSRDVFEQIRADFLALEPKMRGARLAFIPVSALEGDNVVARSARMPWYDGPPLLEHLEAIEPEGETAAATLRFPVQSVIRPHDGFRGFAGRIEAGRVRPGDAVVELPSGRRTRVARIVTFDGDLEEAVAPMSVTLALEDEIDVSRGSMLASAERPPQFSRRLEAHTVWMSTELLDPGRTYWLRHGPHEVQARPLAVRHAVDITTLDARPAASLGWSEIGLVLWETAKPLAFDLYGELRQNGAFIVIDPQTNRTIAAAMIEAAAEDPYAARRASPQPFRAARLTPAERSMRSGHTGALILADVHSAAAQGLERRLFEHGADVVLLDGPVAPLEPLLRAGLLVIAPRSSVCAGFPVLALPPQEKAEDAEALAEAARKALLERGILAARDQFNAGEGI